MQFLILCPTFISASTSFMYSTSNTRNIYPVMYSDTYELRARDHCLTARVLFLNEYKMHLSIAVQRGTYGPRNTVGTISGRLDSEWGTEAWKIPSDFTDGPFRVCKNLCSFQMNLRIVDMFWNLHFGVVDYLPILTCFCHYHYLFDG